MVSFGNIKRTLTKGSKLHQPSQLEYSQLYTLYRSCVSKSSWGCDCYQCTFVLLNHQIVNQRKSTTISTSVYAPWAFAYITLIVRIMSSIIIITSLEESCPNEPSNVVVFISSDCHFDYHLELHCCFDYMLCHWVNSNFVLNTMYYVTHGSQ